MIFVIIVSFDVKYHLRRCLESLLVEAKNSGLKIEVAVVDNASSDGSAIMVKEFIKRLGELNVKRSFQIQLIENQENRGFAKAVNQGLAIAIGDCLLLNPDTVVKPGSIKALSEFSRQDPLVGVIGGRLLDPNGQVQGSCFRLPTVFRALKQLLRLEEHMSEKFAPIGEEPVEVEAVSGAVFWISEKTRKRIGFFDERFFMYFEDLDYCRRVRRSGFKVYYLPGSQFIHHHGASGKEIPEKTHKWLVQSSQVYHGILKYWLITLLYWLGQKWRKFFGKR